jgi:hypothetical protein
MQIKMTRANSILGDDSLHNNNYKVLTSAVKGSYCSWIPLES